MFSFEDLLRNRRSVRNFHETPVSEETIRSIIQDSTLAPSSGNEQPWQFVVVLNKCFMEEISRDCKQALLHRIDKDPNDYAKKYRSLLSKPEYNIFYNAPALVYILGTKQLKNSEVNCTLAASYFMFSAANRGLGTCWISFAKFIKDSTIKEKLRLDPDRFIVAPIIIGYPKKIPGSPPRKEAIIQIVADC
ncbi:nitroreductase family protein [Thermodesulfobacteriota bacterium]